VHARAAQDWPQRQLYSLGMVLTSVLSDVWQAHPIFPIHPAGFNGASEFHD
jgi:hypothetical protein